jgi:hypothetical protein
MKYLSAVIIPTSLLKSCECSLDLSTFLALWRFYNFMYIVLNASTTGLSALIIHPQTRAINRLNAHCISFATLSIGLSIGLQAEVRRRAAWAIILESCLISNKMIVIICYRNAVGWCR